MLNGLRGPSGISVLREADYRRLFIGQTVSFIGDGLAPIALAFAILDGLGSAGDLGIVLASRSAALVLFIVLGGVIADRISPRRAMLWGDIIRFAVMGATAWLLVTDTASLLQLAGLYAIEGLATALFNPASKAMIPSLVAADMVQPANSLLSMSKSVGAIAGPALAGVLLAVTDPGWVLAFDAATFLVGAFFLARLKVRPRATAAAASFLADLREGWSEFSSRTWLWVCVLGATIGNAVYVPAFLVLGPTVANASLGGSGAWALVATCFGIGLASGGALALSLRPRRPLFLGQALVAVLSVPLILLALPASVLSIAIGALAAGGSVSLAEILYDTTLQRKVPAAVLSRVSAYDWAGSLAVEPLGFIAIGFVAASFGTSATLWAAAGVLIACQCAILSVPAVRRIGDSPQLAPSPSADG